MECMESFVLLVNKAGIDRNNSEQLKAKAIEALEMTMATFVDMRGIRSEQTLLDYACELFGLPDSPPLVTVAKKLQDALLTLDRFGTHLRHNDLAMLPPLHHNQEMNVLNKSIDNMISRIASNIESMSYVVYHTQKARAMSSSTAPPTPFVSIFSTTPQATAENTEDQHRLILFGLQELGRRNARRYESWVMIPQVTRTGYNSTAYMRFCEIKEFLPRIINRVQHHEIWLIFTAHARAGDWAARVFEEHTNVEFPDLVRSRSRFAFNNGIYDTFDDCFIPYTPLDRRLNMVFNLAARSEEELLEINRVAQDEDDLCMMWNMGETSADQAKNFCDGEGAEMMQSACMYFDQDFEPAHTDNPMEIETPALDCIFTAQRLDHPDNGGLHLLGWIYALIGRMFYDVGTLDDWQIAPFFKGVAGTGKSTILRVLRMFYDGEDVGVMSNNIEKKFGLSALYNKFMVLCFEMRADFGLDQAELQSMLSGENMSLPVKFKTAISNVQWKAPFATAGNMTAEWSDSNGAIPRRFAMIEFSFPVKESNPHLMKDITAELPRIMLKCNRMYLQKVKEVGSQGPWALGPDKTPLVLPKYFHHQRAILSMAINPLASFIVESGIICRPVPPDHSYYMPWSEFLNLFRDYCRVTGARAIKMTSPDAYESVLKECNLSKMHCEKFDHATQGNLVSEWLLGCKPQALLN
jgi:hypothetical protein